MQNRLKFDLKGMLDDYERRTGIRFSYAELAASSGISADTLKSISSRRGYNTTLGTLSQLGASLGCDPREYLEWADSGEEEPKPHR